MQQNRKLSYTIIMWIQQAECLIEQRPLLVSWNSSTKMFLQEVQKQEKQMV